LLLIVLLIVTAVVFLHRQAISDWIELYDYTPPSAISALAADTTMTASAKHLFYLNHPKIAEASSFGTYCKEQEQAIVLGCYHAGEHGIFLLSIASKSELHGVMQVTAAHEMLHAAYERLSAGEKASLDTQLESFYSHGLHDANIKAEIDAYRKTEPGELDNEMHSIFATEVKDLPSSLEAYYRRYFSNRQAIVAQAEHYQEAFRSRETAVKQYDAQLAVLKAKITAGQQSLVQQAATLRAQRAQLNQERASDNVNGYNAAVRTYNQRVETYNTDLASLKAQINQYNAIVVKRNASVLEEQQLAKELSGQSLPSAQP